MEAAILLKDLSPLHATQTQVLLNGSGSLQFQVENVRKGFPGARYADRFSVLVPCCLDYIKWDIIFNIEHPLHAPDIIFPPEDEKFQAALLDNETLVNAHVMWTNLQDWNMRDSSKLFTLVADLRSLYMQYQRRLVEQVDDSRVRFEIGTLSSMPGLEMCLVTVADKPCEVKFAVPLLQVDCELGKVRHQEVIHLQVIFPVKLGQSWNLSAPQLKLFAPATVREVFDVEDVKLPTWPDEMCISEYLPSLKERIKRQVQEAYASVTLRKNFIENLCMPFGRPIEADSAAVTLLFKEISSLDPVFERHSRLSSLCLLNAATTCGPGFMSQTPLRD
ncbi:hypothetical protein L7F22_008029 [Adiantum nelumboides]|nr:hypothetical protein [Adiantum nelumboides]